MKVTGPANLRRIWGSSRWLKEFRRFFSRFEKLDVMFLGFIVFVLILDALCSVNTP